jgi:hypothetical protein
MLISSIESRYVESIREGSNSALENLPAIKPTDHAYYGRQQIPFMSHPHLPFSQARAKLDSLISSFISDSKIPVPTCEWNQHYISHAMLSVTPHVEARLRYLALCNPSWTIVDLITDALGRGIPLQLGVPIKDAAAFFPLERVSKHNYCEFDYEEPSLIWPGNPKAFVESWLDKCRKIFNRMHARGFVFLGGLLWRLTVEIGESAIMQAAAKGPSAAATVFGRRDDCLEGFAFVDAPSKHEIAIVLGEVSLGKGARSLWPSEEVFRGLTCWQGEWNAECEQWFQKRWNAICSPDGAMPERQGYWKRQQRWGRQDRQDWQSTFQEAADVFTDITQMSWNGRKVTKVELPEQILANPDIQ